MALSIDEREQFLAEPHIAALAVDAGPGRAPLTVPIWYQYTPGGEAWIHTGSDSRKARLIREAGRFSLMVQRQRPTVRYVSVEGPVSRIEPDSDELLHEMAHRYLPPAGAAEFMRYLRAELGEHIGIFMRPERWASSDMGSWD